MICKNRDLEGKKKGSDYRRMISESASSITADQINEVTLDYPSELVMNFNAYV